MPAYPGCGEKWPLNKKLSVLNCKTALLSATRRINSATGRINSLQWRRLLLTTECRVLQRYAGFSDSLLDKNEHLSYFILYFLIKRTTHKTKNNGTQYPKVKHSLVKQNWSTKTQHKINHATILQSYVCVHVQFNLVVFTSVNSFNAEMSCCCAPKVKGHQTALLSAALTRKAATVVSVGTYSAWESTATLRLLGSALREGRRHCVATRTASNICFWAEYTYFNQNSAISARAGLKMVYGCLDFPQTTKGPEMAPYINRKLARRMTWFLTQWTATVSNLAGERWVVFCRPHTVHCGGSWHSPPVADAADRCWRYTVPAGDAAAAPRE